jgi:hypothetical protein
MSDENGFPTELSEVAGTAIGAFFSRLVLGAIQNHQERTQQKAILRLEAFSAIVDQRLTKLEFKMEGGQPIDIEAVLDEPDLAFTVQSTVLAAARISNREKHEVLADALVDRLRGTPEGIRALTAARAIEIIPHITSEQLRLLGFLSLMMRLRPFLTLEEREVGKLPETMWQWWTTNLGYYLPLIRVNETDYDHLAALACLNKEAFLSRPIKSIMEVADFGIKNYDWGIEDFLGSTAQGQMVTRLWPAAQKANQTTVGHLIGQYVHAEKSGESIDISGWCFGADEQVPPKSPNK